MKIGSRIVDSHGSMGTILSFRQHPYNKDVQEAEIKFDDPKDGAGYNHRATTTLHELTGKETLSEVLYELYHKAATGYDNAGHSGNDHAQYVLGAQLDTLRLIAARTLNIKLS